MSGIHVEVPSYAIEYDRKRLKKILRQAGQEVAATARKLIRSAVSPSAPGEPPASRTGTLASSIAVKPSSKGGLSVRVRDSAYYALFLEAGAQGGGGRRGSRNRRGKASTRRILLPHPFLSTALEQRADSLSERIKDSVLNDVQFKRLK